MSDNLEKIVDNAHSHDAHGADHASHHAAPQIAGGHGQPHVQTGKKHRRKIDPKRVPHYVGLANGVQNAATYPFMAYAAGGTIPASLFIGGLSGVSGYFIGKYGTIAAEKFAYPVLNVLDGWIGGLYKATTGLGKAGVSYVKDASGLVEKMASYKIGGGHSAPHHAAPQSSDSHGGGHGGGHGAGGGHGGGHGH